jgi:hypothetical protein
MLHCTFDEMAHHLEGVFGARAGCTSSDIGNAAVADRGAILLGQ